MGPAPLPLARNVQKPPGVDPSYFDYEKSYRSIKARESAVVGKGPDAVADTEMSQFLKGQGLTGPVRAYAKALYLQELMDPAALVTLDEEKLSVVLSKVDMDSTDELLLRSALRAYW